MTISVTAEHGRRGWHPWALAGLEGLTGAAGVYGGIGLIRDGLGMPDGWLAGTPLTGWVLPGVALLIAVAVPQLAAAALIVTGARPGLAAGFLAGLLLVGWIAVQLLILRRYFILQPVIAGIGGAEVLLAWRWRRAAERGARPTREDRHRVTGPTSLTLWAPRARDWRYETDRHPRWRHRRDAGGEPGGGEAESPFSGDLGPWPVRLIRASVGCGTRSPWGAARHMAGDLRCSPAEREMTHYPADHGGLEILPFERCLQLLATVPVGRVGFFADGEIVVLPVNHVMDGPDPVFRTARGSKLSAAEGYEVVAFQADGYDERTRTGWSVLVNGRARAVYEAAEIRRLNRLDLRPWVGAAGRPFWIRIRPAAISGRRIPDPDADAGAGHER